MPQDEKTVVKVDEHVEDRIQIVMVLKGKKIPADLMTRVKVTHEFKKNDKHLLGFVYKHGLVTRVNFDSPFKGNLLTGDVIHLVNGHEVMFEGHKNQENKNQQETAPQSGGAESKLKRPTGRKSKMNLVVREDFKDALKKLFTKPNEAIKIELGVTRFKTRIPNIKVPPTVTTTPGCTVEGAVLYHYKHIKLGINMQQVGNRVVINYTNPDTVASASLNIGEVILAVDDKPVTTMEEVKDRLMEGFHSCGYSKLIVEFPTTDPMKNLLRNQLAQAVRETDRPLYSYCGDVRKYCQTGIEVLSSAKEPKPIFRDAEYEKKKKAEKEKKDPNVAFREKAEEHDIPTEWNSKLFVVLPPLKSKESECSSNSGVTSATAKK